MCERGRGVYHGCDPICEGVTVCEALRDKNFYNKTLILISNLRFRPTEGHVCAILYILSAEHYITRAPYMVEALWCTRGIRSTLYYTTLP